VAVETWELSCCALQPTVTHIHAPDRPFAHHRHHPPHPFTTAAAAPQQQGNARKAVLDFVGKESVDLLVIGMYKGACKRKGLGRRGNATTIYNR